MSRILFSSLENIVLLYKILTTWIFFLGCYSNSGSEQNETGMFEADIESAGLCDPITEGSTTITVFSLKFRSTSFHFHGVVFAQWPIYP